jgi:hypothetical protein
MLAAELAVAVVTGGITLGVTEAAATAAATTAETPHPNRFRTLTKSVELRGLEPLTLTPPGSRSPPDQAISVARATVDLVPNVPAVVVVVVRAVVSAWSVSYGRRCGQHRGRRLCAIAGPAAGVAAEADLRVVTRD